MVTRTNAAGESGRTTGASVERLERAVPCPGATQISVIVVSWNGREYLRGCLQSLRQTRASSVHEVIVVDNASIDGSPEMVAAEFPEVLLLRMDQNLGFARANNLAFERATGSLLALVNSDVVVHPGCLQELAAFLDDHEAVGMVGPRVVGSDGQLQRTCRCLPGVWNSLCRAVALDRLFPRYAMFSSYEMRYFAHDRIAEVEVLSGCFCMVRRKAIDEVGGFDERFFFYAEDFDWCKRFVEAGWKVMFDPRATATHFGGGSTSQAPARYSIEILRANLKYWHKHYGTMGRCTFHVLALVHHGFRLVARIAWTIVGAGWLGRHRQRDQKLEESLACVRWLLTVKSWD